MAVKSIYTRYRNIAILGLVILIGRITAQTPEGCGPLIVSSNNGIKVRATTKEPDDVDVVYVSQEDSMFLSFYSFGGCGSTVTNILLNGEQVNYHATNFFPSGKARLIGKAGAYQAFGTAHIFMNRFNLQWF